MKESSVNPVSASVPSVVVVDPRFDAYKQLADSAREGRIGLHFRSSGADAIRLARRLSVDAWLIAPELDDMSGHDLVELLRTRLGEASEGAKVAMVEVTDSGSRRLAVAGSQAAEAGADGVLTHPITFAELEKFLGLPAEERSKAFPIHVSQVSQRAFVALPVGVGAAIVAIAVLLVS
jgi:CheY-like chemotaxis protein